MQRMVDNWWKWSDALHYPLQPISRWNDLLVSLQREHVRIDDRRTLVVLVLYATLLRPIHARTKGNLLHSRPLPDNDNQRDVLPCWGKHYKTEPVYPWATSVQLVSNYNFFTEHCHYLSTDLFGADIIQEFQTVKVQTSVFIGKGRKAEKRTQRPFVHFSGGISWEWIFAPFLCLYRLDYIVFGYIGFGFFCDSL